MQLLFIILFICMVIFFFGLHVLAKDDLVLVRKNITLESLFNIAFVILLVGLFSARLVFVISNPDPAFLNPLVFFLFPYFPGLSLVGGIIGSMIFLFFYSQGRRLPLGKLYDFFSMSFAASLPFGYLGIQLLNGIEDYFFGIFLPILYLVILIFFVKLLLPLNIRGEIKDGTLGFLFILVFSFSSIMINVVRAENINSMWFNIENVLLLILFFFALAMVLLLEKGGIRIKLQLRDR